MHCTTHWVMHAGFGHRQHSRQCTRRWRQHGNRRRDSRPHFRQQSDSGQSGAGPATGLGTRKRGPVAGDSGADCDGHARQSQSRTKTSIPAAWAACLARNPSRFSSRVVWPADCSTLCSVTVAAAIWIFPVCSRVPAVCSVLHAKLFIRAAPLVDEFERCSGTSNFSWPMLGATRSAVAVASLAHAATYIRQCRRQAEYLFSPAAITSMPAIRSLS